MSHKQGLSKAAEQKIDQYLESPESVKITPDIIADAKKEMEHIEAHGKFDTHTNSLGLTRSARRKYEKLQSFLAELGESQLNTKDHLSSLSKEKQVEGDILKYQNIIDHLLKGGELQSEKFAAFDDKISRNLISNLDKIRSVNEEQYYHMILMLAEVNRVYRDEKKNTGIQPNKFFESVVAHVDMKVRSEIQEMSIDIEKQNLSDALNTYEEEKNPDKKRLILDFIYKKKEFSSETNRQTIISTVGQDAINDMLAYQETVEYKIYSKLPILEGHTAENIFTQSPEKTQAITDKLSKTSLGRTLLGPAMLLGIVYFVFSGEKIKGKLMRAILVMLGFSTLASAKEMGMDTPDPANLLDDFGELVKRKLSGLNGSESAWKNNEYNQEFAQHIINADQANTTNMLGENKIIQMLDNMHNNSVFAKVSTNSINDFVENGSTNIRDIFGDKIPVDENGVAYSYTQVKQMLSYVLQSRDAEDKTGAEILFRSSRLGSVPGTNENGGTVGNVPGTNENGGTVGNVPGTNENGGTVGNVPGTGINSNELRTNPYQTIAYTDPDGANFIIGPNEQPTMAQYEQLSPEYAQAIETYSNLNQKINNLMLVLDGLVKYDDSNAPLQNELNNILSNFAFEDITNNIEGLKISVESIASKAGVGHLDLTNEYDVLSYIRDNLDGWKISRKEILLNTFNGNIETTPGGISNEDIADFISNPIAIPATIRSVLGENAVDIKENILEKRSQAQIYINENRDEILGRLPDQSKDSRDNAVKMIEDMVIGQYTETSILKAYIDKNGTRGNKQFELFKDIEGIGWLDFADSTIDFAKGEALEMAIIEAVAILAGIGTSMLAAPGAGYVAVKGALYAGKGARYVAKINNGLRVVNNRLVSTRLGTFARNSVVEGAGFHLGYVFSKNRMGVEQSYIDGMGQSILMVGAMRGVNNIFKGVKGGKIKFAAETTLGTGALAGFGAYHEGVLFEPGEWSAEHIYQALIMYLGMRATGKIVENGMSKIKFRKNPNGNIEMQQSTGHKSTSEQPKPSIKEKIKEKVTPAKTVSEKINKMKDGDRLDGLGEFVVIRNGNKYEVYKGGVNSPRTTFSDPKHAINHVNSGIKTSKNLELAVQKGENKIFNEFVDEPFKVGKNSYQVSKNGDNWELHMKGSNNGYSKVDFTKMKDTEAGKIIEHLSNKGAIGKISAGVESAMKKSFSEMLGPDKLGRLKQHLIDLGVPVEKAGTVISGFKTGTMNTAKGIGKAPFKVNAWSKIKDGWTSNKGLKSITGALSGALSGLFSKGAMATSGALMLGNIMVGEPESDFDSINTLAVAGIINPYAAIIMNGHLAAEIIEAGVGVEIAETFASQAEYIAEFTGLG